MKYIFSLLFFSLFILSSCTPSSDVRVQDVSATEQVSQENLLYIDVREDNEWAAWHIEWAIHVKLWDIQAGNYSQIPKDTPVALYCRSGNRSGIAYDILSKAWYTNITNAWGITEIEWVKIVQ